MSGTGPEPSNWELSRSITRIENAVNGLGARLDAKLDGLAATYVTRSEHDTLAGQVQEIKADNSKRFDRAFNVYLGVGLALLAAFGSLAVALVTR